MNDFHLLAPALYVVFWSAVLLYDFFYLVQVMLEARKL